LKEIGWFVFHQSPWGLLVLAVIAFLIACFSRRGFVRRWMKTVVFLNGVMLALVLAARLFGW
jgi:hypothetical protein